MSLLKASASDARASIFYVQRTARSEGEVTAVPNRSQLEHRHKGRLPRHPKTKQNTYQQLNHTLNM